LQRASQQRHFLIGGVFCLMFELFLSKILKTNLDSASAKATASKTEKFSLHFFKFRARQIFSKSLPRHQLCRILLFQKIKAEGGFAFKTFSHHFLFQSWCLGGGRKIFCFGFLLIREKRKRSISNRKRAKIPSPQPLSFLPACFSGFARFFCGATIKSTIVQKMKMQ